MKKTLALISLMLITSAFALPAPTYEAGRLAPSVAVTGNGLNINGGLINAKDLCKEYASQNNLVLKEVRPFGSRTTGNIYHVDAECIIFL